MSDNCVECNLPVSREEAWFLGWSEGCCRWQHQNCELVAIPLESPNADFDEGECNLCSILFPLSDTTYTKTLTEN